MAKAAGVDVSEIQHLESMLKKLSKQAKNLLTRLKESPPKRGPDMKALRGRAQKGELKAQLELAQRHEIGAGVPVNVGAVRQWLKAATAQGSSAAAHRLGGILMLGRAGKKEPAVAVRYWKLAAELGYGGAQVDYAVACAKGDGLEKNLPEAYYWSLIARRGNTSEEQERNLAALNRLIEMTHARGLRFTVGIWDHIYRGGVQGPRDFVLQFF